jgi:hypothetical protein
MRMSWFSLSVVAVSRTTSSLPKLLRKTDAFCWFCLAFSRRKSAACINSISSYVQWNELIECISIQVVSYSTIALAEGKHDSSQTTYFAPASCSYKYHKPSCMASSMVDVRGSVGQYVCPTSKPSAPKCSSLLFVISTTPPLLDTKQAALRSSLAVLLIITAIGAVTRRQPSFQYWEGSQSRTNERAKIISSH